MTRSPPSFVGPSLSVRTASTRRTSSFPRMQIRSIRYARRVRSLDGATRTPARPWAFACVSPTSRRWGRSRTSFGPVCPSACLSRRTTRVGVQTTSLPRGTGAPACSPSRGASSICARAWTWRTERRARTLAAGARCAFPGPRSLRGTSPSVAPFLRILHAASCFSTLRRSGRAPSPLEPTHLLVQRPSVEFGGCRGGSRVIWNRPSTRPPPRPGPTDSPASSYRVLPRRRQRRVVALPDAVLDPAVECPSASAADGRDEDGIFGMGTSSWSPARARSCSRGSRRILCSGYLVRAQHSRVRSSSAREARGTSARPTLCGFQSLTTRSPTSSSATRRRRTRGGTRSTRRAASPASTCRHIHALRTPSLRTCRLSRWRA